MSIKILFSPSETKNDGGNSEQNFIFSELLPKREFVFNKYIEFLKSADEPELSKLFGVKTKTTELRDEVLNSKCMPAIERYSGVAYDYLDFNSLDPNAKEFINNNCIIFSNLFGPISANDMVPNYKLKQGETFCGLKLEDYYKESFSKMLDDYLDDSFILDLRAGFYDKFYKPSKEHTTLKFLKDGKVVSHWAKVYRGLVLKAVAIANIQNKNEFMNLQISGLKILEIKRSGLKEEIAFEIV